MTQINLRGICPYCSLPTRFELTSLYPLTNGRNQFQPSFLSRLQEPVWERSIKIEGVSCAACGGVVVYLEKLDATGQPVGERFTAYPFGAIRPIPVEVEKESPHIASDYREATATLNISPKASAALSRRCLQTVLREKAGAAQKDLVKQIEAVLPKLPSYIAENVDAIRNVGNFAAHPQKDTASGAILDVELGEAEWNLDVLDELFDFYYVQPAKAREKRDKLNEKLGKAGKPPLK